MKKSSLLDRLSHHCLLLVGLHGWDNVTAARLAKSASAPVHNAEEFLATSRHTLRSLADYITRRMEQTYQHEEDSPPRDALFAMLMARFDILQDYRDGIIAINDAARLSPALFCLLISCLPPQMATTLQLAQVPFITPAHSAALTAIYCAALRIWQRDDSPDLARTMAALDKYLRTTEMLLNHVNRIKT
jgi:hypothetical protein